MNGVHTSRKNPVGNSTCLIQKEGYKKFKKKGIKSFSLFHDRISSSSSSSSSSSFY